MKRFLNPWEQRLKNKTRTYNEEHEFHLLYSIPYVNIQPNPLTEFKNFKRDNSVCEGSSGKSMIHGSRLFMIIFVYILLQSDYSYGLSNLHTYKYKLNKVVKPQHALLH
jgi:hypothetical protein